MSDLSPREQEVADLLVAGRNAKHISKILSITHQTVKQHCSSIYRKLNVKIALRQLSKYCQKDTGVIGEA